MWQDWFFALTGLIYGLVLIPSCLDCDTEIPRSSSVPTAILLSASVGVWLSMGMGMAAVTAFLATSTWIFLAIFRPIHAFAEVVKEIPAFECSLSEAQLIMEHREWVARKQREAAGQPELGETGCGPS